MINWTFDSIFSFQGVLNSVLTIFKFKFRAVFKILINKLAILYKLKINFKIVQPLYDFSHPFDNARLFLHVHITKWDAAKRIAYPKPLIFIYIHSLLIVCQYFEMSWKEARLYFVIAFVAFTPIISIKFIVIVCYSIIIVSPSQIALIIASNTGSVDDGDDETCKVISRIKF